MGAKVQHRIGFEFFAHVAVKSTECMRGCKAFFKQQTHRVTFVTKARLQGNQHIAQLLTQHHHALAIGQMLARCRAPLRFDLVEPRLFAHMLVGGNDVVHIGLCTILFGVAVQQTVAQCIHALRQGHVVALLGQRMQCVVERFKHRQKGGGADTASIGWEVEQHDCQLALCARCVAQCHQLRHTCSQHLGALTAGEHVLLFLAVRKNATLLTAMALLTRLTGAAAIHHRQGGTVEFGNGHHHGALHRQQTALRGTPLIDRLKLHRVRSHIRHIQALQHRLRRF